MWHTIRWRLVRWNETGKMEWSMGFQYHGIWNGNGIGQRPCLVHMEWHGMKGVFRVWYVETSKGME